MNNEYVLKPWSSQNNRLCNQGNRLNLPHCCSITRSRKNSLKHRKEPSNTDDTPERLENGNLLLAYSPMNDLTTDFMDEVKGR